MTLNQMIDRLVNIRNNNNCGNFDVRLNTPYDPKKTMHCFDPTFLDFAVVPAFTVVSLDIVELLD